jgi:hypothetical protein
VRYSTGEPIKVGDSVIADGMTGVVVCDFDKREFLEGFSGWDMRGVEMLGGGTLSSGIMVETADAGMVHYENEQVGDIRPRS